jgi:hypothetical protein
MRIMIKLGLALSVLGFAVLAQESTSAIPRNDEALRNAIKGLGKKPIPIALQRQRLVRPAQPATGLCSVPLTGVQLPKDRVFRFENAPPSAETVPMPQTAVPAPPCEAAAR